MKKLNSLTVFLVLSCTIFSYQCMAQESSNDGWQVLFNGKDLSGWHLLNGRHQVEIKDSMIIGTCIAGLPNGFIATKEEYDDFILEVEIKADLLLHNSGIQFRSLSYDEYRNGRVHGYQAEIDITPQKWSGGIYDEARRGWLYILEDDTPAKGAFKNNQWNKYRIEAIGNTIRIWINGIPTAHLVDDKTAKGFIALQLHGNSRPTMPTSNHQVYFRNIRIKTENIEPSPYDDTFVVNLIPNHISAQEEKQGFSLLWDGESTQGWRGIYESGLPETGWKINEGVLTITSSDGEEADGRGVMMTEKRYDAFELKFDFMQHDKEGIAGLELFTTDASKKAIYGHLASRKAKEVGEWNQGAIKILPDDQVEYWLNGYKILEYYRDSEKSSAGHILLSDYGSSISYRSIKIRELN